jgi:hypothetical protein
LTIIRQYQLICLWFASLWKVLLRKHAYCESNQSGGTHNKQLKVLYYFDIHRKGNLTIVKSTSSHLSYSEVLSLQLESVLSKISRYDADLSDSVESFISSSLGYIKWTWLWKLWFLMDRSSSIYPKVCLIDTDRFYFLLFCFVLLLSRNSFWTKSASFEYKNKSTNTYINIPFSEMTFPSPTSNDFPELETEDLDNLTKSAQGISI